MQVNKTKYSLIALLLMSNISFAQAGKKDGDISLKMTGNDSMHVATAAITDAATHYPLKGVEITFYVKRTFGLMKVGGGTTDTTGVVSAEFPLTVPGSDASRKILIVAKVEDNDVMNDASAQAITQSKVPFPTDKPLPREMISSRAPWWLVITFTLVAGTVWLLFAYVIYLVRGIKRASVTKMIS